MKEFFQRVIGDLREKRLLPVAIVMIAGLVAVPVLLAKPAKEESATVAADPVSPAQTEATKALVALADEDSGAGSTLKLFDPRNPFAPDGVKNLQSISSEEISKSSTELASSESEGGGSAGGGSSDTTGGGGGSTGGGGTGGVTPTPNDDGGNGGGGSVTTYAYVLDATFTSKGKAKKHKGLGKLSQLPSEDNPLLLFLGVDATGDNAVFLVDSTLSAEGEGNCSPSTSDCATLSIGPGAVEHFTDEDGNVYTLRIDEIRKEKVGKASSADSAVKAKTAEQSDDEEAVDRQVRRFIPPVLADLVTVATEEPNDSSSDKDRR